MEVIKICPLVEELSEVRTNIKCTESGCAAVFPNSSSLEMHLIKTHCKESKFLNKKDDKQKFCFFCPIVTCKYSMVEGKSENELRWFSKLKYLKQHYFLVHKQKNFICTSCGKSFLTEKEKTYHSANECGVKFTCQACGAVYNSHAGLESHCKRKHRLTLSSGKRLKKSITDNNMKLVTPWKVDCPILPKPVNNPIENIAAAALSELSWKIVVRGVDKGVQTTGGRRRTPIRSLKKRDSQETQTGDKRPKVSQETQTMSSYKNRKKKEENEKRGQLGIQTQTFHDLFPELSGSGGSTPLDDAILPQLYTSSTQTGEQSFFNLFEDHHSQRSYSDQIDRLIQSSLLESRSCNIQTQTETEVSDSLIEPIFSHTETQTIQNAIDEYSHNYTQTCDDIFLNDFVEFSDIETQTAWATLDVDTCSLVSAETQTSI